MVRDWDNLYLLLGGRSFQEIKAQLPAETLADREGSHIINRRPVEGLLRLMIPASNGLTYVAVQTPNRQQNPKHAPQPAGWYVMPLGRTEDHWEGLKTYYHADLSGYYAVSRPEIGSGETTAKREKISREAYLQEV